MVIATRPKPASPHHKKRHGHHQRQTKDFSKTYWPYLPMIGITALVNVLMGGSGGVSTEASLASTTRIEAWTSIGSESALIAITLATAAFIIFLTRHALVWHRILVKSEAIVKHNHMLDMVLVAVVLTGFILTRAAY